MYIRTTAPFTIDEDWMKKPLELEAGTYASVSEPVGMAAIQQGAAVPTTLEEIRANTPGYVPLEDVEALAGFAADKGAETAPLSALSALSGEEPVGVAWTPPPSAVEAVAKYKGKAAKKSN